MNEAFGTALASVKTDVLDYMATALPVALTIMGTIIAVKLGVKFFKSICR